MNRPKRNKGWRNYGAVASGSSSSQPGRSDEGELSKGKYDARLPSQSLPNVGK